MLLKYKVGYQTDRTLLASGDMNYLGMWRVSPAGGATDGDLSFCRGPIALRNVGGSLRLLVQAYLPAPTEAEPYPRDLLEFTIPETYGSPSDIPNAPNLIYVRRWEGDWASGYYWDSNGSWIGGMWYDHDLDVLWYTIFPPYQGPDDPYFLGASKLNDDGSVTKYGPWKHPLAERWYCTAKNWIYPAPASLKAVNPNADLCIGAAPGSTNQFGNWGPGLYWFKKPDLGSSGRITNDSSNWGPLMGYSNIYGSSPTIFCHRDADYYALGSSTGYWPVDGGVGYWLASRDQMSGHVWVETANTWGIVTLGRMMKAGRYMYYSTINPVTVDEVEYYDCGSSGAGGNYRSHEIWLGGEQVATVGIEGGLLIFNPAHVLEVASGSRDVYDVQYYERANWNTLWAVPYCSGTVGTYPGAGDYPIIESPSGQPCTSAWDSTNKRILWMQPKTYNPGSARYPTIHAWSVV